MMINSSFAKWHIVFLLYFFSSQIFLVAQVPKLSWGVYLPEGSLEHAGVYLDTIKNSGFSRSVLVQDYYSFYKAKPDDLKQILKKGKIKEVGLIGGEIGVSLNEEELANWVEQGKFLKRIGGKYLILTSRKRDTYPPGKEELEKVAANLNSVGEKLKKHGIRLVFQNQLHRVCQTSDELQLIIDKTSGKFVGILLEIPQLVQTGGDPISFAQLNKKRLDILVFQELVSPKPGFQGSKSYNYQLVDLGKVSKIDIPVLLTRFKGFGLKLPAFIKSAEGVDIDSFGTSLTSQSDYLKSLGYSFK